MHAWAVVVAALLASGCIAPASERIEDTQTAPPEAPHAAAAAKRPAPAPTLCHDLHAKNQPSDHQAATGVVKVTVYVVGNRPGSTYSGKQIAAVSSTQDRASSDFDVEVFFNNCAYASTTSDGGGVANLWVKDQQEFRLAAAPATGHSRPTTGPFVAREGLSLRLDWLDPDQDSARECGRPSPPFDLPPDEAFAKDLVVVRPLVVGLDGKPLAGASVAALNHASRPPFDAVFGVKRFFTSCVWAAAVTAQDGRAELWLPRNATIHFLVVPDYDQGGGGLLDQRVTASEVGPIVAAPNTVHIHEGGTIMLPNARVEVQLNLGGDADKAHILQKRYNSLGFTTLAWTNGPAGWGDLFGGFRAGDGPMYSPEIFDEAQGPLDGPVHESLVDPFFTGEKLCKARAEGLRSVVYSVSDKIVAPAGLPFVLDAGAHLRLDPLFTDPFDLGRFGGC